MTPQDWQALRRYLRGRTKELHTQREQFRFANAFTFEVDAALMTVEEVQSHMRQILSRRRRQRKQVA
jgi:hypothetical protein